MTLKPLTIWLVALNLMCLLPWSDGRLSFFGLLAALCALAMALRSRPALLARNSLVLNGLAGLSIITAMASIITGLCYQPEFLVKMGGIIDIGANTYAATDAFAKGLNPYTHASQLWVDSFPANTPHISVENGQVTMFGVPYFYGYPYFPLMFLSYLPAYFSVDGYLAIRLTHLALIALNLVAFKLIIDRYFASQQQRHTAMLIALSAYFGLFRYAIEAIMLGVTDMLISTYLLFAFAALQRQRYFVAGVLLGCAQACKLLPAPFILLAVVYMLYLQRGALIHNTPLHRVLAGFAVSAALIILPFIAWHPEGFLSSTILYYLTHHQNGDQTSLWYFLPAFLQSTFLLLGLIGTVTSIFTMRHLHNDLWLSCLSLSFGSYVIFMAFSKMTHLNYLWGVFPLGALALALALCKPDSAET